MKKTFFPAPPIGITVLTPLQVGATSVEKTIDSSIQNEEQIKGTIKYISLDGINLKGKDGKKYFISFNKFSTEQIQKMKLVEEQEISIKGSVVDGYSDFFTFEVYKKEIAKGLTKEELTKLENLFNEMKKLQKKINNEKEASNKENEKKYEELKKIYEEMRRITKPYALANWQPQLFEEYIADFRFNEQNVVIKKNDNAHLKAIYNEWVKLKKSGDEEKANEKYEEFYKFFKPYLDGLNAPETFEEFMDNYTEVVELLNIPSGILFKLKTIHEDLQKTLKDKNDESYEKLNKEFWRLLNQFIKPQPFEEFMADLELEVSKADKQQLKQLYEEALALVETDEEKEKWKAFYNLLTPYLTANEEILISASKLTINDQVSLPQN
ncbi:hypothetical protein ABE61_12175 [Lysinibacillus sphaericus]|uniref:hypothetical protein n=1 Tax=Lysinibacillus sphaericus TaxID=1421 RepID=UPI001DC4461B|nr:hypothetical protein [Lysinibacillus sphaericus]MBG9454780.1 hypothetical protein [Lysinibacillus sphaericus]MBG9478208.1 hypothetical protein [Lysinibacillus sphaericus]MBG9590921.1 hypothetical protein [Lysinibacillus sphaericus]